MLVESLLRSMEVGWGGRAIAVVFHRGPKSWYADMVVYIDCLNTDMVQKSRDVICCLD
jgi:hypothetical protein